MSDRTQGVMNQIKLICVHSIRFRPDYLRDHTEYAAVVRDGKLYTWKEMWLSLGLMILILGILFGSSDCKRCMPIP